MSSNFLSILLTTLFFLGMSKAVISVEQDVVENLIADWRVGKTLPVFSDICKVYEHASKEAKSLDSLTIGTSVKVLARMTALSQQNGFEDAWFRVEYKSKGNILTGYIWGGDLALAWLVIDNDTQFVSGILSMKTPSDPQSFEKLAEVRIVVKGTIVSRASFTPVDSVLGNQNQYGYDVKSWKLNNKGFSPKLELLALKFIYNACDYPNGDILFTWDGKKVSLGPTITTTNSADYSLDKKYAYILPSSPEGVKNCIMIKFTETPKKSGNTDHSSNVDFKYYIWNGDNLVTTSKCNN